MEKKRRSFTKIKQSMSYGEFKKFCIKITEMYANSKEEFARSYFMKEYAITANCFYKILETSVIYNWVSEDAVDKMEAKALANQKAHATAAGVSTRIHYAELRTKRQDYILSAYTEIEIEDIATRFAKSLLNKKEFAKQEEITVKTLDLLLKKAIVEAIVDDIVFDEIRQRSIDNAAPNQKEKAKAFFVNLSKERYSKISELLSD